MEFNLNLNLKTILTLFIIGVIFIFCGFAFGENLALILSSNGYMSDGKLLACTYTPVIVGVYFLICSLILFKKYTDKNL